jgi:hypothetical protein
MPNTESLHKNGVTRPAARGADTVGDVTLELGPDDKLMPLRYAGRCRLCGIVLDAGAEAVYERSTKTVRCGRCKKSGESAGVAGSSARREHDRRHDARERRIRTNHPKLGGLILALTDDPQSTKAWQQGAIGEEQMARRLADLPDTFHVLHDRRIPGTRANIDHIVIGPTGIWVIDAKRYNGKRPTLHVEGGILRPRVERLRVGGRDATKLVDGVRSQRARMAAAVDRQEVPVEGVLCFLEADWPLFGDSFAVDGIHITWPRRLLEQITSSKPVSIDVATLRTNVARAFPSA